MGRAGFADFLDLPLCVSGYCGADIRAVCTEAALCALRRHYPQIYGTSQKLLLDVSSIAVSSCDFLAAMRKMSPAARRLATTPAKPLSAVVHPLLGATLQDILEALQRLFPHAEQGMKRRREPGESELMAEPLPNQSEEQVYELLCTSLRSVVLCMSDLTSGILDDGLMSGGDEASSSSSISAPSTSRSRNFLHFAR